MYQVSNWMMDASYEVPCSVLIKKAMQYSNKILELIYVVPVFKHLDITYKCRTFLVSLCFDLFFFFNLMAVL